MTLIAPPNLVAFFPAQQENAPPVTAEAGASGQPSTSPVALESEEGACADGVDLGPIRVQIGTVEAGVELGGTISLPVRIKGVCDLTAFQLWVGFDQRVVSLVDVLPAPFLAGDPPVETEFVGLRPDAPRQTISAGRPEGSGGVDGVGTLARLIFQGTAEGSTTISLVRLGLFGLHGESLETYPVPVRLTVYPARVQRGDPRRRPRNQPRMP